MRKLTLGLATSLDNYIARKDGGADWLRWNQEVAEISARFMKTADALLIGRKTYEVMLANILSWREELRFLTNEKAGHLDKAKAVTKERGKRRIDHQQRC
ncbi:MAG TPA: hypothetical protein VE863_02770 [Pyrinomonadaceae bacterium]|jgi:dihydrofolate reductase|nr:hypothetical protein [Pyrinomonadaceae bacterium]